LRNLADSVQEDDVCIICTQLPLVLHCY
jgi:hypothetical protein